MRTRVDQSMGKFLRMLAGILFLFVLVLVPTKQAEAFDAADGFNPDVNGTILAVAVQPDGKILIGGAFTDVNGTARNYIARLNSDGGLDTTFDPGAGTNARVDSLALQPDGKILLGGPFSSINGTTRYYLGRVSLPEAAIQSLIVSGDAATVTWLRSGGAPS